MGITALILGESGSGKTYSLKNFNPNEIGIFSVRKGTLPFPEGKDFKIAKRATYETIYKVLKNPTLKAYAIDDSQYLMVNEFFRKANDTGYKKYTDIGKNFSDLFEFIAYQVPDDVIVYFLHHTQVGADGKIKAKTVGQMLDNYLTLEGCTDICLLAQTDGSNHYFITQSDGSTTAKSPEGMFDLKIPNDLKMVDTKIREYYGLGGEENRTDNVSDKKES
jgi:hypothetical protein